MACHRSQDVSVRTRSMLLVAVSVVTLLIEPSIQDMTANYCSNQNTGVEHYNTSNIYNSDGYCSNLCLAGSYAFGVVQGQSCWCSNYVPSNQQSISVCNEKCPGYPYEFCGNTGSGLFGYLQVGKPSGTMSASAPTSSLVPLDTPVPAPVPAPVSSSTRLTFSIAPLVGPPVLTQIPWQAVKPSVSPISSPTSSPVSSPPSVPKTTSEVVDYTITEEYSTTPQPIPTPTPVAGTPSVQIVTVGGTIITSIVTSVPTIVPDKLSSKPKVSSTVGAAIGAAAGAVILLLILVFGCLWLRRRREGSTFEHETGGYPRRNTSILSKTGLLGTRMSSNGVDLYDSGTSPMSERRKSQPITHDQRLNPNAFMTHDDGSSTSVVTMQDNRDYTRTLNVRNPDPVD